MLSNPELKLWDGESVLEKERKFEERVRYIIDRINAK